MSEEYTDALPVGIVHHGVEALVGPLPEDCGRGGPVEGHHAACNDHVTRDLGKQSGGLRKATPHH